eukprot:TRINITY_DN2824_c0_g2_i1.p1 TRINITY_DN2824_c0_g2~~TRINITY_DN2824_c0_g2_i1.p1  ORF type:complete len:223 (-),score=19.98 TRINITY_DN2824_c0_g2_i1:170-838(-)
MSLLYIQPSVSISIPNPTSFNPLLHVSSTRKQSSLSSIKNIINCKSYHSVPLRFLPTHFKLTMKRRGSDTMVCRAALKPDTLQWVCAVSSVVLMLAKGTPVQKSFLVPLFALQAPASVISWIKGEYGMWSAFLALLVRLFYHFPGELELPFLGLMIVIVAPYQALNLRGTQAGAIVSLALAGYMAFQHFSRIGSLQKAFDQGSIVSTLAIICMTAVPCLFLF